MYHNHKQLSVVGLVGISYIYLLIFYYTSMVMGVIYQLALITGERHFASFNNPDISLLQGPGKGMASAIPLPRLLFLQKNRSRGCDGKIMRNNHA